MSKQVLKKIERLCRNINQHDTLYYVNDSPIVSDREYDLLMRELKDLEEKFPEFICRESPTQRVGGKVSEKFKTVVHSAPMLSLDNA